MAKPRKKWSTTVGGVQRAARVPRRRSAEETYKALDDLYKLIPTIECRGKCQGACGPIDMTDPEHRRIVQLGVNIPRASQRGRIADVTYSCPALTILGQCRVYDVRPLVCRIWGAVKSMDCSYGCKPEGGYLTEQWGMALLLLVNAIADGRALTVDQALAETAHLSDPAVLKAWMTYRAAGSNPNPPEVIRAAEAAFAAELRHYQLAAAAVKP